MTIYCQTIAVRFSLFHSYFIHFPFPFRLLLLFVCINNEIQPWQPVCCVCIFPYTVLCETCANPPEQQHQFLSKQCSQQQQQEVPVWFSKSSRALLQRDDLSATGSLETLDDKCEIGHSAADPLKLVCLSVFFHFPFLSALCMFFVLLLCMYLWLCMIVLYSVWLEQ